MYQSNGKKYIKCNTDIYLIVYASAKKLDYSHNSDDSTSSQITAQININLSTLQDLTKCRPLWQLS